MQAESGLRIQDGAESGNILEFLDIIFQLCSPFSRWSTLTLLSLTHFDPQTYSSLYLQQCNVTSNQAMPYYWCGRINTLRRVTLISVVFLCSSSKPAFSSQLLQSVLVVSVYLSKAHCNHFFRQTPILDWDIKLIYPCHVSQRTNPQKYPSRNDGTGGV